MRDFDEVRRRAEGLLPATSPIYAQAENRRLEAVGTGIFFAYRDRRFVLSASHVLMRLKEERLLIGGKRLVLLNGRFFTMSHDDIDLAFVPLNDEQCGAMSDALFLTADDVETSAHPETKLDGHRFYIVGFRADDNQPEGVPTTVDSSLSSYLAQAAPADRYQGW